MGIIKFLVCTRINKMFFGIKCFHFVSIVYSLLICRDFCSFTANFKQLWFIGYYCIYSDIILEGLNQNETHACNTNDFPVEISLGF